MEASWVFLADLVDLLLLLSPPAPVAVATIPSAARLSMAPYVLLVVIVESESMLRLSDTLALVFLARRARVVVVVIVVSFLLFW